MVNDVKVGVDGGTRLLEGASTAASVPSILGFIAVAEGGRGVVVEGGSTFDPAIPMIYSPPPPAGGK